MLFHYICKLESLEHWPLVLWTVVDFSSPKNQRPFLHYPAHKFPKNRSYLLLPICTQLREQQRVEKKGAARYKLHGLHGIGDHEGWSQGGKYSVGERDYADSAKIRQSNNSAATPLKSAKLQTWEWLLRGRLRRGAHCSERPKGKGSIQMPGRVALDPRYRVGFIGGERFEARGWLDASREREGKGFFLEQTLEGKFGRLERRPIFFRSEFFFFWLFGKLERRREEELGESKLKWKEEKFVKLDYIYEERLTIFVSFFLLFFLRFIVESMLVEKTTNKIYVIARICLRNIWSIEEEQTDTNCEIVMLLAIKFQ